MVEQAGNRRRYRWPVFIFVLIVLGATIYAFSPRALAPFPPTTVKISDLLVTGLAQQGQRVIAVGELGEILWRDGSSGPWQHAKVADAEGLTFTHVKFVAPHVAIAVGHGALIERSADGGETWQRVSYQPKLEEPLMGVSAPINGKLYAYGFFGLIESSTDTGKTWTTQKFDITPLPAPKPAAATSTSAFGQSLLANFVPDTDPSTLHIYGIKQLSDGNLLLVGERGLIALSTDGGATWTQQPKIYPGSFFGILKPTADSVLIYGLGGHVFRSTDGARTWTQVSLPEPLSVFGGTVLADGHVVLVGGQESVWTSSDGGQHFSLSAQADRGAFDTVLGLSGNQILAGGIFGARAQDINASTEGTATGARS